MSEACEEVFQRWGIAPIASLTSEQREKLLAISLGLGAIFDENQKAERQWMRVPHSNGKTPLQMIAAGEIDAVLAAVEKERGL